MRCTIRREPNLKLPELPRGVTEITVGHGRRTFVLHSRMPWPEVMAECEKRFTTPNTPIGGPAAPDKAPVFLPSRRAKKAAAVMPYKDA